MQHVSFYWVADFHCTPERFIGVIPRSKMDIPVQQLWIHWLPTPAPFLNFHQPRSTGQSRQILETEKYQQIISINAFSPFIYNDYMLRQQYFHTHVFFIVSSFLKNQLLWTYMYIKTFGDYISLIKIEL